MAGRGLGEAELRQLIADGRTGPLDGFRSKAGRPFTARLRLDAEGKVGFDFADGGRSSATENARSESPVRDDGAGRPPGDPAAAVGDGTESQPTPPPAPSALAGATLTCPKCGHGRIIEGRRGYGCARWRDGCDFVIWKEIAGHRLSGPELKALVDDGRTGPIDGLVDGDGLPFTGRILLDGDKLPQIEPAD